MQTPDTQAGRTTAMIMAEIVKRLPGGLPIPDYNIIYSACLSALNALPDMIMGMKHAIVDTVGGTVEGHPTQTINYLQRLRQLVRIECAAQQVASELRKNCGTTADWPLDLIARDEASANRIAGLLQNLDSSLQEPK